MFKSQENSFQQITQESIQKSESDEEEAPKVDSGIEDPTLLVSEQC